MRSIFLAKNYIWLAVQQCAPKVRSRLQQLITNPVFSVIGLKKFRNLISKRKRVYQIFWYPSLGNSRSVNLESNLWCSQFFQKTNEAQYPEQINGRCLGQCVSFDFWLRTPLFFSRFTDLQSVAKLCRAVGANGGQVSAPPLDFC